MKFLFDFLPFLVFFITYMVYDFYVATAALIVASVVQLVLYWLRYGKIEKMLMISVTLVIILGSITLFLHDTTFLKWKASVFSWISALVFLSSHFIGKKVLLQRMFTNLELPKKVWQRWNMAWVIFLTTLGSLNLFVAYKFSTDVWVYFKMFGFLGLMLLFLIIQAIMLAKYLPNEKVIKPSQPSNEKQS